ncbi:hypothetical protein BGX28_009782 [Mortierella sp. GBA30]|nr:hypothetical protein BGX28_009782 [Mortierella sp. GBA30]
MDSTNQHLGILSMNLADLGLLDDCSQSNGSSAVPIIPVIGHEADFDPVRVSEQSNGSNSYLFPGNDLASVTWDNVSSKQQGQTSVFLNLHTTSSALEYTPELSPALSYATPAVHSIRSPYGFDVLGPDEFGASPSIGFQSSPMDESLSFGSQQSIESFDFGFGVSVPQSNAVSWPAVQADFQLFPENFAPSVSSLEQLLMTPVPAESLAPMSAIIEEPSPLESDLDYFSPFAPESASPAMSDYDGLFDQCEETQVSGCRPSKRRRRCRKSTEEACRIESCSDDPKAKDCFRCEICGKDFTRAFNLRSHRSTHSGVKPFSCTHFDDKGEPCNRPFARRHDLERHVRSIHSKEKLFKCKTCGRECGRNDAFKRHLQRHPVCGSAAQKEQEEQQEPQ